MEEKDIRIHDALEDEELGKASGGGMDCAKAPKVHCPVCMIKKPGLSGFFNNSHKIAVTMDCYAWYNKYSTNEYGYCYRCPECGHEERRPVKE